jgi:hypothetical protein
MTVIITAAYVMLWKQIFLVIAQVLPQMPYYDIIINKEVSLSTKSN